MRTSDFDPISVDIFNRQLKRATWLVLLAFSVLIFRLWFLQVFKGGMYRKKSEDNRFQLRSIPPFRGVIFDRKGRVLVGNRPSYDLYVSLEGVSDRAGLIETLHRLIGLDPAAAERELSRVPAAYPFRPVCLRKGMNRDELAVIETHRVNLPGVMIKVTPERYYVRGAFCSHLLGYLGEITEAQLKSGRYPGLRRGDLIGKSGVERTWQADLNGRRGGEQVEVDAEGRRIRVVSRKPAVSGAAVCLTIDSDLQCLAERLLSGKRGAVVAVNPEDGQVLALASSPSFDPNLFVGGMDRLAWRRIISSKGFPLQNRALAGQYPPGSVFKIIVALAGLEEGVIDPEEKILCNGRFMLGSHEYRCWKRGGHGRVNLHRALKESCDVYFYQMGKRLGIDRIARYARRFGLGRATGIDVGREKPGLVPSREWKRKRFGVPWQAGETISVSIGQSFLLVTPIQMAGVISAVFNGGVLYRPQVTRWVRTPSGRDLHRFRPRVLRRTGISRDHLERVKKALIAVVNDPHGTGGKARLAHVTVAGKTGTSQVVTTEKERISSGGGDIPPSLREHAWFVAVAPAEHPKIALAVVVEHGGHGGRAAAPIAGELIRAYLGEKGS